jgi:hypothetical protein
LEDIVDLETLAEATMAADVQVDDLVFTAAEDGKVSGLIMSNGNAVSAESSSATTTTTTTTMIPKKRKLKLRMQLYQWLCQPKVEVLAAAAVLLSSLLVALSTLNDLSFQAQTAISAALYTLDIIFALDFFVRWYSAGQFKFIYLTKPLALIDIVVVILPLLIGTVMPLMEYVMSWSIHDMANGAMGLTPHDDNDVSLFFRNPIQDSAGLQNLLLLRVLRLRRVLTDMTTFGNFAKALGISRATSSIKPYQLQLARVLLSIFTLLSVSSGLIYTAEHNVNPLFSDYFTALYFGLTSLTTVGFGDITPVTPAGRLVVCASIIAGVAIIPAQAAKFVEALLELQKDTASVEKKLAQQLTQRSKRNAPSSARIVYSGLADGKGPSGVNIEAPAVDEQTKSMKRRLAKAGVGDVKDDVVDWETKQVRRICSECGEPSHRVDANFCWSCGNPL